MRTHLRLGLYVTQEFLFSFFIGFLFFFFVFFVNILLVMAEQIFAKNVPINDIALLLLYSTPQVISLTFPFAALIGSLMAMGRLSSDNELLAMRASGVPLRVVFRTVVVVGLVFSGLSFVTNDYLLPVSSLRMNQIYRRIIYTNPGIELAEYSISRQTDLTIVTGRVQGSTFLDLTLLDRTEDQKRRLIFAREATLKEGQEIGVISLELKDVIIQLKDPKETGEFEYSHVDSMIYNVPLKTIQASLQSPGPREMSSVDVWAGIVTKRGRLAERVAAWTLQESRLAQSLSLEIRYARELVTTSTQQARRREAPVTAALTALETHRSKPERDRTLEYWEFEFHKKLSLPVACVIFFAFAYPVGLLARRSGRAVGFGVGLIVSILYWGLLVGGQTLAPNLHWPAALGAWAPDAVVLVLAVLAALISRRVES